MGMRNAVPKEMDMKQWDGNGNEMKEEKMNDEEELGRRIRISILYLP